MIKFTLTPYDVLFFGSGRPFNRGDVVASIFPPLLLIHLQVLYVQKSITSKK